MMNCFNIILFPIWTEYFMRVICYILLYELPLFYLKLQLLSLLNKAVLMCRLMNDACKSILTYNAYKLLNLLGHVTFLIKYASKTCTDIRNLYDGCMTIYINLIIKIDTAVQFFWIAKVSVIFLSRRKL